MVEVAKKKTASYLGQFFNLASKIFTYSFFGVVFVYAVMPFLAKALQLDKIPAIYKMLNDFAESELFQAAWALGPITLVFFIALMAVILLIPALITKWLSTKLA